MNPLAKIQVYIFPGIDQHEGGSSVERIRRCASLFVSSEGGMNPQIPNISRKDFEKPCFTKDIGLHFSVSHSGQCWVCAVSKQQLGIDIQKKCGGYQKDIAKRFFHPDEYLYLEQNEFNGFFDVWTAKESYVKYTGRGIDDDFAAFSVVEKGRISKCVNGARLHFLPIDSNYCMCICAEAIDPEEISIIAEDLYTKSNPDAGASETGL